MILGIMDGTLNSTKILSEKVKQVLKMVNGTQEGSNFSSKKTPWKKNFSLGKK